MFGEKNDGLIGVLIGFGLGFIAAIILYKPQIQAAQQTKEGQDIEQTQFPPLSSWRPLSAIPSVDRLGEFKPMPVLGIADNVVERTESGTAYKNDEKWIVKRNENGRIIGYQIDRKANINK